MTSHVQGLDSLGWNRPMRRPTGRLGERIKSVRAAARVRARAARSLPLDAGEQVLVVVCSEAGRWVAGTDRALYHTRRDLSRAPTAGEWARMGWEETASVEWDAEDEAMTVTGLLPTVPRRTVLRLPAGARVALLARERIGWTEVVRTRLDLGAFGAVRVVGRRTPGTDELVWLAAVPGGGRHRVGFDAALEAALGRVRADLGL
jgi:hypothetical protein